MQIAKVCVWVIFCFCQSRWVVRGHAVELRKFRDAERRNHRHRGGKGMRNAACHVPLPGGDLRKSQIVVSTPFYRNVYFPINGHTYPYYLNNSTFPLENPHSKC